VEIKDPGRTAWAVDDPRRGANADGVFDGFPIRADLPTGNKEARAEPFAAQSEAGNVSLVRGVWNAEYIEELCLFPLGPYAD
jgi:phage terminase large subunit-like protein